jgi:hypothetical protein
MGVDPLSHLRMGEIYRYARPYSSEEEYTDGLRNFFFSTLTEGKPKALLEKGISPIASVGTPSGARVPAILISSSPHKIGSEATPWQDVFDVDNGLIRYFGDNKSASAAELSPGNKVLLEQFRLHTSPNPSDRSLAAPVIFFQREEVEGRKKGNVRFQGVGVLQKVELITQFQKDIGYFTNYVFEFVVLSLSNENETLDWEWITARRDASANPIDIAKLAPSSYSAWLKVGQLSLDKNRRKVRRFKIVKSSDQLPIPGTKESKALETIYKYFHGKKHKFEILASKIVAGIVSEGGAVYKQGWVTQASSDMGVDFVGRLDVGHGFSQVRIVVLGQAKCEKPSNGTSALDIARTVARLKRGWIGAYVTTSFFTDRSQLEIMEDDYPLMTVSGGELAKEALKQQLADGFPTLEAYLDSVVEEYSDSLSRRRPEEVLLD